MVKARHPYEPSISAHVTKWSVVDDSVARDVIVDILGIFRGLVEMTGGIKFCPSALVKMWALH